MKYYQQHFRTRRREINKIQISLPFHTCQLVSNPLPLIVLSEASKRLRPPSPPPPPCMSLQGGSPPSYTGGTSSNEAGFKTGLVRQLLQFLSTNF